MLTPKQEKKKQDKKWIYYDFKSAMETWRTEKKNIVVALVTQCLFSSSRFIATSRVFYCG